MSITGSIRISMLAVATLISGATVASAQSGKCPAPPPSPSYSPDFTANQNCLVFNGLNSSYSGSPSFAPPQTPQTSVANVMRLTANQGGWAASAWYQTPQLVANGFSTTFSFQIGMST